MLSKAFNLIVWAILNLAPDLFLSGEGIVILSGEFRCNEKPFDFIKGEKH